MSSVSVTQTNRLCRVFDAVYRFCSIVSYLCGGIAIFGMTVLITVDVVGRKLGYASYVGDEVSGYLLVGVVFLGLTYTQRNGKHIQITAVSDWLFPGLNRVLNIANLIISIIVVGWMAWHSAGVTIEHYTGDITSMSLLQTPLWIPWLQIPLGLTMFLIGLVANLLSYTLGEGVGGGREADGVPDLKGTW